MTTTIKQVSLMQKVHAWFKARKKADDNIERSEPETFLATTQAWIFGIIMSMMWMMIAYAVMTDQATDWIARMLLLLDGPFETRFATLTAVFVLFSDTLVIFAVALNREASNDDIVDVVNDLGEQIDERFVELENTISENIGSVQKELEDITVLETRLGGNTHEPVERSH